MLANVKRYEMINDMVGETIQFARNRVSIAKKRFVLYCSARGMYGPIIVCQNYMGLSNADKTTFLSADVVLVYVFRIP